MSVRDNPVLWLNAQKSGSGATALGGNTLLATPQHKLDGPEHLTPDDTTTLDASTSRHGLLPKISGVASDVLHGDGAFGSVQSIVKVLTNKSGASVAAGDVVVISAANADAFTTTTTAQAVHPIGVAQETIANNASGRVALAGYVATVNTNGSTFGLRTYLETNGSAKQATANTTQRQGSFGVVLSTSANPDAILFGSTNQGGSSSVTFGTPALTFDTTNAAGSIDEVVRRDAQIALFDGTSPVTQAFGDSAATGSAGKAARRDHKHGMPTAAITTSGLTQATAKLLGRSSASTGAVEEIAVGTGLTLSGGTLASTGGGSVAVQYPSLKPGTPTYDFAGAALDGAFSAHSSQGSFATGSCMTQGEDWIGSALEMQFSAQMGALYVTHADTDLDFDVGGLRLKGFAPNSGTAYACGIAALNSSGTGVGVLLQNDGNAYLATVTAWNFTALSDTWSGHGLSTEYNADYWLRLKRVSGTWTGYASQSGRAWDKTFSTRADSITVDRLAVGLFFSTGTAYSGRMTLDYLNVAV